MDNIEPNYVLSGASSTFQLEQNLKALSFQLSDQELAQLSLHKKLAIAYWKERKQLPWN